MQQARRFKVGDQVTYKDAGGSNYKLGVFNRPGVQTGVISLGAYRADFKSWLVQVQGGFWMLESEFEEYDIKPEADSCVFPSGAYVVLVQNCAGNLTGWGSSLPSNYVYKLREASNKHNFKPERDMNGSVSNGWDHTPDPMKSFTSKLELRAANIAEINEYDLQGGPVRAMDHVGEPVAVPAPRTPETYESLIGKMVKILDTNHAGWIDRGNSYLVTEQMSGQLKLKGTRGDSVWWHYDPNHIAVMELAVAESGSDPLMGCTIPREVLNKWANAGMNYYSGKWSQNQSNFISDRTVLTVSGIGGKKAFQVSGTAGYIWLAYDGFKDFWNKEENPAPKAPPMPAKPTPFKKDDYIVNLGHHGDPDLKVGYVFKQREDYHYLRVYKDCKGSNNGIQKVSYSAPSTWRMATPEEIAAYDQAGKPVDVTQIKAPTPTQEELLAKAIKNYPVGTKYKTAHTDMPCTVYPGQIPYWTEHYLLFGDGSASKNGHSHSETLYDVRVGKWAEITGTTEVEIPIPMETPAPEDLLKKAKRLYPIDTKYIPLTREGVPYKSEYKANRAAKWIHTGETIEAGAGYVYVEGKWAEIISTPEAKAVDPNHPGIVEALSDRKPYTGDFKNCVIFTPNPSVSEQVQKDLFTLGFKWAGVSKVKYTNSEYLATDHKGLNFGSSLAHYSKRGRTEVTPEELRAYVASRYEILSRPIPTGVGIMEQIDISIPRDSLTFGISTLINPFKPEEKNLLHKEFDIKPLQLTISIHKPKRRKVTL